MLQAPILGYAPQTVPGSSPRHKGLPQSKLQVNALSPTPSSVAGFGGSAWGAAVAGVAAQNARGAGSEPAAGKGRRSGSAAPAAKPGREVARSRASARM